MYFALFTLIGATIGAVIDYMTPPTAIGKVTDPAKPAETPPAAPPPAAPPALPAPAPKAPAAS